MAVDEDTPATHVLFESASGYALFKAKQVEEIGAKEKQVQDSILDLHKFGKMVELISFVPFKSAAHALENANDVSEGICNDYLKSMLELNLSGKAGSKKSSSIMLAVSDKSLASSIAHLCNIPAKQATLRSLDLIRGIRLHSEKLLSGMPSSSGSASISFQSGDMVRAQLGLGHSYSRCKVKFNVNRSDNMIIQAIALLDQLDKDVNTFSMRIREWYGYTFPELSKLVTDNLLFAKVAKFVGNKSTLDESKLEDLAELVEGDSTLAKNILDAARSSMGTDLNELDSININNFASRVVGLAEYRKKLVDYLSGKMNVVAPSLTALMGERIGARLISHAGSLVNLSKYPASTVQILGAEKALFRALKTKGNTPKYGLIYHSSFIGRAGAKHKGRISRFLANKCSIASRIDCFSDNPTSKFGDALRNQVEERLTFFETGTAPTKNSDTMKKVLDALAEEDDDDDSDVEMADGAVIPVTSTPTINGKEDKKEKYDKKVKSEKKEKEKKGKKEDKLERESPKKDKSEKKEKKEKKEGKKDKKRKAEEMEIDIEAGAEQEETEAEKAARKAAKKAKKEARASLAGTGADAETPNKSKRDIDGEPEKKKKKKSKD